MNLLVIGYPQVLQFLERASPFKHHFPGDFPQILIAPLTVGCSGRQVAVDEANGMIVNGQPQADGTLVTLKGIQ